MGDLEPNRRSRENIGCHVAMSQRRDAWSTNESQQVTQRRDVDVTTISAPASLKARGDLISRYRGTCGFEGGKQSSSDPDYWRRHFLLYFLFFDKLRMIVRLIMVIFSSSMF